MLHEFAAWLQGTPPSIWLAEKLWVVPAFQSIHIIAVAVVVGSSLMVALRSFGAISAQGPLIASGGRFIPRIWMALGVLLATGLILTLIEPPRELDNDYFKIKMALVVVLTVLTVFYKKRLDRGQEPARIFAVIWLAIITLIIFAGRWIAYAGNPYTM
jgi:hypothetical protein